VKMGHVDAYLFTFNVAKYKRDLGNKIKSLLVKMYLKPLHTAIYVSAAKLPWKDNPVQILTGAGAGSVSFTSDRARAGAVLGNIQKSQVEATSGSAISMSVKWMASNWKDSHIGLYYEHGTGENQDGLYERMPSVSGMSSSSRNKGKMASRTRFVDYLGNGNPGTWRDMGGNLRYTGSLKAGQADAGFRNYVGEDVEAHYWFHGPSRVALKEVRGIIKLAIRSVPLTKYLKIRPKFMI